MDPGRVQRTHRPAPRRATDLVASTGTAGRLRVGADDDRAERDADALARAALQTPTQQLVAAPGRVVRRTPNVIRRATVVDLETGEELRPLTIQELVDGLSDRVRRRLAALPASMLSQLAALPPDAQQALLLLPEDTQLDIIAALQRLAVPELGEPIPHDLISFLRGTTPPPLWLTAPDAVLALPGPGRADLSPDEAKRHREKFGDELATTRDRPQSSGVPVTASPAVSNIAAGHKALADARAERERDEKWAAERSAARSAEARQDALNAHAAQKKSAQATLTKAEQTHQPPRSKAQARKWTPPKELADARQAVADLEADPDVDSVAVRAERERIDDLLALRGTGLTRPQIDGFVAVLGSVALHDCVALHGAGLIGRLLRALSPSQTVQMLDAVARLKPGAFSDVVIGALAGLFAAGADADLIVGASKALGPQLDALVVGAPLACVRLVRVSDRRGLKSLCQGGQAGNLLALAALLETNRLSTVVDCIQSAADLGTLCGPGVGRVAPLFACGVGSVSLTPWCRAPILPQTVQLLSHADHATLLAVLPILAAESLSPVELMQPVAAGSRPAELCPALNDTARLLQTPKQTLNYFRVNPGHTCQQFKTSVLNSAATEATRPRTNPRQRTAQSGATYTEYDYHATIDCATLHLLLAEGRARLTYVSTFRTTTEAVNGGDTEEYDVEVQSGNAWHRHWVIHLHRSKGHSRNAAPTAMHLKRYDHRRLKEATRLAIDTRMADRCRAVRPDRD